MFKIQPVFMTVSLFCGLALPTSAQGQFLAQEEVLRGLEAVFVVVGGVKEDAMQDGLSRRRLRDVTELTLRSAGVPVESAENIRAKGSRNPRFRQAYLYVNVNATKVGERYALSVSLGLNEIVKLVDDSGLTYGEIWENGLVATTTSTNLLAVVDAVRELVERFANDYLAANPRNR